MSEKSATLWKRRPGLVGFLERMAMAGTSALEQVDLVARAQGDVGPLGAGPAARGVGAAVSGGLALAVEGVHLVHLHPEGLLHRPPDLDLGGPRVDDEHVDVALHEGVGLLG